MDFNELIGKTFHTVTVTDDEIHFKSGTNEYKLSHAQDCCEHVYIESITGGITDHLPNNVIMDAYESYSSEQPPPEDEGYYESYTWSFYTIRTMRDTFVIRFFGSSNGYYGESAELVKTKGEV